MLGAIALASALLGVVIFADTRYQRTVDREFLADGVETVATEVQLHIESGKGGHYVGEVEAVFPVATGRRQRTTLVNNLGDDEGGGLGWRPPGPATRYASPMTPALLLIGRWNWPQRIRRRIKLLSEGANVN